ASEILECFGGAGYVEDTGIPVLLRDAQVLSIWEGTTNVLALDTLRALGRKGEGLAAVLAEAKRAAGNVRDAQLARVAESATRALGHAQTWLGETVAKGEPAVEAGARRFALTLGLSLEAVLLAEHAQWALDHGDARPQTAALRFVRDVVIDLVRDGEGDDRA